MKRKIPPRLDQDCSALLVLANSPSTRRTGFIKAGLAAGGGWPGRAGLIGRNCWVTDSRGRAVPHADPECGVMPIVIHIQQRWPEPTGNPVATTDLTIQIQ